MSQAYTWRRPGSPLRLLGLGAAVLLLTACGGNDMSDLRSWIEQQKQREGGSIDPIPEMETFDMYEYPGDLPRDPFTTLSFARQTEPDEGGGDEECEDPGVKPEDDRPEEELEKFALDSLSYVGTLERGGELWALIEDSENTIHRVQSGDYMGQNNGKVRSITPRAVQLREIVRQDGCWEKRTQSLALDQATGS